MNSKPISENKQKKRKRVS